MLHSIYSYAKCVREKWISMRPLGPGTAGRKGRSASRSVASLFAVWFTMIASIIYQMPALAGAAQAMPMSASAVVSDIVAPCNNMGQAESTGIARTSAMPDALMPCCDMSPLDSGEVSDHSCPLMGGCFSMCASITPKVAGFRVTERLTERLGLVDDVGIRHSVPPLQRPPKYL